MTPFDFVAQQLELRTSLSRLEARGTLRIALREAGLDASADARQLEVVLRKLLPGELAKRGIEGGAALCEGIANAVLAQSLEGAPRGESPEAIFQRLGGR